MPASRRVTGYPAHAHISIGLATGVSLVTNLGRRRINAVWSGNHRSPGRGLWPTIETVGPQLHDAGDQLQADTTARRLDPDIGLDMRTSYRGNDPYEACAFCFPGVLSPHKPKGREHD
jgi:hypothetical protein